MIPVMTRDELIAADLTVERRSVSVTPRGSRKLVVYRYATEEIADNHLAAELAAWRGSR
jgi:hypothetical protein